MRRLCDGSLIGGMYVVEVGIIEFRLDGKRRRDARLEPASVVRARVSALGLRPRDVQVRIDKLRDQFRESWARSVNCVIRVQSC